MLTKIVLPEKLIALTTQFDFCEKIVPPFALYQCSCDGPSPVIDRANMHVCHPRPLVTSRATGNIKVGHRRESCLQVDGGLVNGGRVYQLRQ